VSIVIFCGPTLAPVEVQQHLLGATALPPAGQGDLYRAARERPKVIGLIDGTFERAPAVWHKEILWALSQGIHVFGSSSMGALRAAELATFGMVGVGRVFQWFDAGVLEDDDEVAIAHASAAERYRPTSEALVNIRATLAAAEASGVLERAAASQLLEVAKSMYYADRSYPALLRGAQAAGISKATTSALAGFLERGRIDQKRLDALALMQLLQRERARLESVRLVPSFYFEHTDAWEQAVHHADKQGSATASPERTASAALWAELRLCESNARLARRGVLLRALAAHEARRSGLVVTPALRDVTQEQFRRERGLEETTKVREWLARNRLSEVEFGRFLESETCLRWLEALYRDDDVQHLTAELVSSGEYEAISRRAALKQELLLARGLSEPEPADAGLDTHSLLEWYFRERLGREPPAVLSAYARELGINSEAELQRDAMREYMFQGLAAVTDPGGELTRSPAPASETVADKALSANTLAAT
jgi:hypothetical protein